MRVVETLRNRLIVSCQAGRDDSPMNTPDIMAAFAKSAEMGGAAGIRADGPENIKAIRKATTLPIIGIQKMRSLGPVYITPTFEAAEAVVQAGADIVAIDATDRKHPDMTVPDLIRNIREVLGVPVMADVSTVQEGILAWRAGADIVATTLAGYTPYSRQLQTPDFELIAELVREVDAPVIAEGRIHSPTDARRALEAGAYAVVVGTAITNPIWLTETYVQAVTGKNQKVTPKGYGTPSGA